MRSIALALLFACLFLSPSVTAQETFRLPDNQKGLPVNYLEGLKVKNTARVLGEKEKHEICRMFVKAFVVSLRQYGQDYLLRTNAPVYRLLVANFPEVTKREGEGGIFLGGITSFFNSQPEYRGDVIQVLRQGISQKNCKPS